MLTLAADERADLGPKTTRGKAVDAGAEFVDQRLAQASLGGGR
jgi:hypothetical protein